MKRHFIPAIAGLTLIFFSNPMMARNPGFNYDEEKVPEYTLPDPLEGVVGAGDWPAKRAATLALFETHVFGKNPVGRPEGMTFEVRKTVKGFLDGKATMREVRVWFDGPGEGKPWMDMLIVAPAMAKGPVPAVMGLNFGGNHSVHPSKEITLSTSWMRPKKTGVVDNRATEEGRGISSSRWPLEMIVERNCALVTIYYGDIDPDFHDGFENGVHAHFQKPEDRDASSWGSIAGWSWGLSRALDYLQTDDLVDGENVVVFGHSRLGKTSLWAGATDERFAGVISNDSGCGGAALSRRAFGETVERINTSFPHWFAEKFRSYNGKEGEIPVDQHQLISLIAPRPVYVASAVEDEWADPNGEFLSAKLAGPVYELLGKKGVGVEEQPAVNMPVGNTVRYHVRTGKHDVTDYDWEQYLKMVDELIR